MPDFSRVKMAHQLSRITEGDVSWHPSVKKIAAAAKDLACHASVPLKLNRIAIMFIEIPKPRDPPPPFSLRPPPPPNISGLRQPKSSRNNARKKMQITNVQLTFGIPKGNGSIAVTYRKFYSMPHAGVNGVSFDLRKNV